MSNIEKLSVPRLWCKFDLVYCLAELVCVSPTPTSYFFSSPSTECLMPYYKDRTFIQDKNTWQKSWVTQFLSKVDHLLINQLQSQTVSFRMMVPNTQKVNSLYDELMVSTQWSSNEKVCFETRSLTSDNSYTLSLPNESIQTYCSLFCEQQLGHSLSIIQLKNPNTPPHPVPPEKVLPNPSIEQDGRAPDSCCRERNFRVHRVAQEEFIRQKF